MLEKTLTDNPPLFRSILGTADPQEVRHNLDSFCKEHFGSEVEKILLFQLGTGAAFGLLLTDKRRIFLKAHPPERPAEYLEAVHRVQAHLHHRDFPCPKPILGPRPFGVGLATIDDFMDTGEIPDAHHPKVRRKVAKALVHQIQLAEEVPDINGLEKGWPWPKKDALWSQPHNALLGFEATKEGAEWIDETAAESKTIVDDFDDRVVVGHTDWSADQIRTQNGKVSVVYDWDSLRPEKEVVVVGIAASNFTATWSLGAPNPPSPAETRLFIEDYEAARSKRFSEAEREAIAAAAIYAIAYIARCEHALDMEGKDLQGSFREVLPQHQDAYSPSANQY